jgi:hypothetical protein
MRMWGVALAGLWVLVLVVAGAAVPARAEVVIYRCTDALGALTMQNDEPCPKGSREERTVVDTPPPMPAYVPSAPVPRPVTAVPARDPAPTAADRPAPAIPAAIADADRLPPPPIYRCNTWDNDSYLSEDPAPKPRCVRLQTTGPGGDASLGAGAACEMKYDQCERIGDTAACEGWRTRQREVESGWRHAKGADKAPLQEEFVRVGGILADTTCGIVR